MILAGGTNKMYNKNVLKYLPTPPPDFGRGPTIWQGGSKIWQIFMPLMAPYMAHGTWHMAICHTWRHIWLPYMAPYMAKTWSHVWLPYMAPYMAAIYGAIYGAMFLPYMAHGTFFKNKHGDMAPCAIYGTWQKKHGMDFPPWL
jgi:hypothetical protein